MECVNKSSAICGEFKPLPEWGADQYHVRAVAATASNYRLRKMVVRFHERSGNGGKMDELVRFYEYNREAVVKLRKHFGLYVGRDFWKLEQEYDESICTDIFRKVYGGMSRQTVGELN